MSHEPTLTGSECIHCGFCLETCPTYVLTGHEEESPRGRILLAGALASGRVAVTAESLAPLDHCLGCLACETACPSGVPYRSILDRARALADRSGHRRSRWERFLLRQLLTHPRRLRVAAGLYRALSLRRVVRALGRVPFLPPALRERAGLAPVFEDRAPGARSATPPPGAPVVLLLRGCAARVLFPSTEDAMAQLLGAAGYRVERVDDPTCCGALAHHAGDTDHARRAGNAVVERFRSTPGWIVPTAAGCGAHLRDLGDVLAAESRPASAEVAARVKDLSELLLEAPRPLRFRPGCGESVVYQDPCHLRHAQGITLAPRRLLAAAGAELREAEEAELCCGSAGSYHLALPETSARLGRRKRDALLATGARTVVTSNPGCWVQLRAGWPEHEAPALVSLARFLADRLEADLVPGGTDRG